VRVLVTGAAGQLGTDVVLACRRAGDDVVGCSRTELDVTDRDAVHACISTVRPNVVINTAAWTAVDACEADPDRAYATNALGVRWLADAARLCDAHLVQVSTDYVFSGDKDGPYLEWDAVGPRSVYGASKAAGEREAGPDATVVRTSWVAGAHGPNMVKTILRLAAERDELTFVDDQVGHPTFADDLAPVLRALAVARLCGIVHVTNQRPVSWFALAREVLEAAGLDPDRVRPISTAELTPARPAPRPANSVLDNAVLRLSGWPLLPDHGEPLERLVHALGR